MADIRVCHYLRVTTLVIHDDVERPIAGAILDLNSGILGSLWVAEGYRRQGLAMSLIKKAEEIAKDEELADLILVTHPDNLAANRLFAKLGYKFMHQYSKQITYGEYGEYGE